MTATRGRPTCRDHRDLVAAKRRMLRGDRLEPRDPRVDHRLLLASERDDDEIGRAREVIGKLERATLQVSRCEMRESNRRGHVAADSLMGVLHFLGRNGSRSSPYNSLTDPGRNGRPVLGEHSTVDSSTRSPTPETPTSASSHEVIHFRGHLRTQMTAPNDQGTRPMRFTKTAPHGRHGLGCRGRQPCTRSLLLEQQGGDQYEHVDNRSRFNDDHRTRRQDDRRDRREQSRLLDPGHRRESGRARRHLVRSRTIHGVRTDERGVCQAARRHARHALEAGEQAAAGRRS